MTSIDSMPDRAALPKLSPRLQAIFALLPQADAFEQVWDCCCDHGLLGAHILAAGRCGQMNFVDQVAEITAPLEDGLQRYGYRNYRVLTADCSKLEFEADGRHLVIIAGVGGRALISMLRGMLERNPGRSLRFILCATNCVYELREYLAEAGFTLIGEQLVADRGRDYEVIDVGLKLELPTARTVSATGAFWQPDNPQHRGYRDRLLAHYRRQQRGRDSTWLRAVIKAYQQCW